MKISTKGRYALRLMIDLAINDDGKCIRIRDIAKRQEISDKYLEQIISILNRAGYIKSVRGPQGGHRLAKHPSEYTVGMILRLTEGSLSPVACLDDEVNQCTRQAQSGAGSCCAGRGQARPVVLEQHPENLERQGPAHHPRRARPGGRCRSQPEHPGGP